MQRIRILIGRIIFWLVFSFSLFSSIGFGYLAYSFGKLPYNEMGRYFDEASSVVYHEQDVDAYIVFCLFFGLIFATTSFIYIFKKIRRSRKLNDLANLGV